MRQFLRPGGIDRLSLEARVLYTGFIVFLLAGYASAAWLYADDDLGAKPSSAQRYYLGDLGAPGSEGAAAAPSSRGSSAGPALDLPPEDGAATVSGDGAAAVSGGELRFAKPPRQVLETLHFHLFSVPVVLLVVGHLYMMCDQRTRTKVWIIALSSLATFVHVLAPALVRLAAPGLAFLVFPSAIVMSIGWMYMTLWPLWELWRGPLFGLGPEPEWD